MKRLFLFLRSLHPDRSTLFIGIILYSLLFTNCFSQSGWFVKQTFQNCGLKEIFFLNPATGWIAIDSGNFLKTTNGGENWALYNSGYTYYFYSVKFFDAQTGWAAGGKTYWNPFGDDYGIILKTSNGGINWTQQFFNMFGSIIRDLAIVNQNIVYAVMGGASGNSGTQTFGCVLKTTNSGFNWIGDTIATIPNFAYTSVHFINQYTGWIMGQNNVEYWPGPRIISRTSNGGQNWSIIFQDTVVSCNEYFSNLKIRFSDSQNGYISYFKIQKSTNAGANWFLSDSLLTVNDINLFFINKDTGWICSNSFIKRTNNGGFNWTNQITPYSVSKIFFVNALTGWGLGGNGRLLKTTTGGTTFIKNISGNIPDKFILYQNYPNPFNPTTVIKYSIPMRSPTRAFGDDKVVLKVFDILGKEVATLVKEKQSPGTYEVTFDGSSLTSGVYYYRLTAGDYIETKKMLMIK